MADKDEEIARLKARVAELEGSSEMRAPSLLLLLMRLLLLLLDFACLLVSRVCASQALCRC